jgi:hypothetical protein
LAAAQQALPQWSAALLLCQDLLGSDPQLECLDRNHPQVAHILRFGKRLVTSNQYRPIREAIPSTQYFLNEFRLHSSLRYRFDLIERSLFRPRVWHRFNLPDALFPLYALLSPIDWMAFHLRHRLARFRHAIEARRVRTAAAERRSPTTRITFRRIRQLTLADIALVAEAACMLTFFRLALNFLPVQRLTAWMGKDAQAQSSVSQGKALETIRRVEWSIGAVVRHGPLTFVCFPQSLAGYFMLRRRHIASKLFYGVTRDADQLKAHTWLKVGDRTVVGGDVESQFTVLNTFP